MGEDAGLVGMGALLIWAVLSLLPADSQSECAHCGRYCTGRTVFCPTRQKESE